MRYIVIFLLLLNFAYYSWSRYRPSQSEAGPGSEDLPLLNTGLMLVREFDEQAATLSAADQDQSPMCALVANFPTADEAYSFMSESSIRGFSAVLNLTGEALAPQFRVYHTAFVFPLHCHHHPGRTQCSGLQRGFRG